MLTSFGTTISDRVKKNNKTYPKKNKQWIFCHIRMKPILAPVNPNTFPPDTAHVCGHDTGLKVSPSDEHYVPWLIVKKSGTGKNELVERNERKVTKSMMNMV